MLLVKKFGNFKIILIILASKTMGTIVPILSLKTMDKMLSTFEHELRYYESFYIANAQIDTGSSQQNSLTFFYFSLREDKTSKLKIAHWLSSPRCNCTD